MYLMITNSSPQARPTVAHCRTRQLAARGWLCADGDITIRINQQEEPEHERLFRSLGTFRFEAGNTGWVRISNEGTEPDKVVVADAVQFLPGTSPKP